MRKREEKTIVNPKREEIAILAHRGVLLYAPENTLPSFAAAVELGFDLEIDVQLSKDGQIVVLHDSTVNRTTNGEGAISDMTLAEIKALDAGSWFDDVYAGVTIPTFEEVLALVRKRERRATTIAMNMTSATVGAEEELTRLIEKYEMIGHIFAFDMPLDSAKRFKGANPKMLVAARASDRNEPFDAVKALSYIDCIWAAELDKAWLTADIIKEAHQNKKEVHATGGIVIRKNPTRWRELIDIGVDGACVDDAVSFRSVLRKG